MASCRCAPKHYYGFGKNGDKVSCKGLSKRQNSFSKNHFLEVLKNKKSSRGVNVGFGVMDNSVHTYEQKRQGLSYYYGKRKGDYVRISKYKGKFDKSYLPNWSREIFILESSVSTVPVTYKIQDQNKEPMKGTFYEDELQKVDRLPQEFRIENILKKGKEN
ncbi:hypothetical protein CAPTEDRAFT_214210 [Capitella teleta]|uniref:Uncharacterized protein n=1 Tax=Capitella teleta TaxID=283909 RepID=R7UAV3_CAPTE|nr:hypothetical protein CAPTEDRAFT_214210 [Capitella teleta]|eukprot:ELU03470.1 hypothetical protein CAPTEDRAFT_214210 [Capitella teleta]